MFHVFFINNVINFSENSFIFNYYNIVIKDEGIIMIILNIHAHPDDAEWGCGGTMAKLAKNGAEIYYLVCTKGDKGTIDLNVRQEELAIRRSAELKAAAKLIGVKQVFFLDYNDGELAPNPKLRGELMYYIRKLKPDIVFTLEFFNPYEYHPDHRAVGLMAFEAAAFAHLPLYYPEQLELGVKPWFVKQINFYLTTEPNEWIDISETIDIKLRAIKCHTSQLLMYGKIAKTYAGYSFINKSDEELGSELIESFIKKEAEREGKKHGMKYAEGFRVFLFHSMLQHDNKQFI